MVCFWPPCIWLLTDEPDLTSVLDFNISAPAFSESVPAFNAYCSGFGEGAPFDDCQILDDNRNPHQVAARLEAVNTTGTGAHLAVSYEFADPTAEYVHPVCYEVKNDM